MSLIPCRHPRARNTNANSAAVLRCCSVGTVASLITGARYFWDNGLSSSLHFFFEKNSGKDHMNLDWVGIHEKICQLLVPLRSQPLIIGSEEERVRLQANMQKSQRALIDLTRMESTKFLVHGNYEHAIPGAVQALRFSLDVFGPGRIELVPCHLLLAEANLGFQMISFRFSNVLQVSVGKSKPKNTCLSQIGASSKIQIAATGFFFGRFAVQIPMVSFRPRLKSQLYRNFGKLYASQGKYEEALRQLANDIYFSSLQVGPDHVDTAGGFYYLATVFYLQKRVDCALAMCDKVIASHSHISFQESPHPPAFISSLFSDNVADEHETSPCWFNGPVLFLNGQCTGRLSTHGTSTARSTCTGMTAATTANAICQLSPSVTCPALPSLSFFRVANPKLTKS